MNNKELISIIVPVYNVEKYLNRCVDSLVAQTYSNLEIILVDDGSLDRSGEICDVLAMGDPRIKVVHKENGGLSSARNAGIAVSKGKYVGFIDSDDWVSLDMYEYLINLMRGNNADVAQINFKFISEYTMNVGVENEEIKVIKNKDILQHYMTTTTMTGSYSVCRCLFKRSLLDGLTFRLGKLNEDIDFKYKVLSKCKTYVESNLVKYFYFQSTGSLTTTGLRRQDFDLYDAAEQLYNLAKEEKYGTISFLGEVKKARTAFSLLCKIAYYGISDKTINRNEIVRQLTIEHRKNLIILLKAPMKFNRKIVAILLAININLLEIPLKILKSFRGN